MKELLSILNEQKQQKYLENIILKKIALYHALGEIRLLEMIGSKDDGKIVGVYNKALYNLYSKNLIDIVYDKTQMMSVIRGKHVFSS